MFALIQRGQIYTDSAGYPIKIVRCINNTVLYRRMDGRTQSVKINDFNERLNGLITRNTDKFWQKQSRKLI